MLLKHSCGDHRVLRMVHASLLVTNGLNLPTSFASSLITSYANYDDLSSALMVFNTLKEPDTLLWNLIIKIHVDLGLSYKALLIYKQMRKLGAPHDGFTFPIINKMVVLLQSGFRLGEMVQCLAMEMGFERDVYFCNTAIECYVKFLCLDYARRLFDEMSERDLISWTSMISGYVQQKHVVSAFALFNDMRMDLEPNSVTVMVLLGGCSYCINGGVTEGRQLHGYAMKKGFLLDHRLKNSILKMYASGFCANDANNLFKEINNKDVVSWNIMISSLCMTKQTFRVVDCFYNMQGEVTPNSETLTLLVSSFAECGSSYLGEELHCFAIKRALCNDILKTSLLDMYAKSGEIDKSTQLFNEIIDINSITWNALMSGFIYNGYFIEAIELFQQMSAKGFVPVAEILKSLVVSCTHMGAFQLGKAIHGYTIRNSFDDTPLETSVLNMYLRCGCISSARVCFERMVDRDLVAWTSMIEGCGIHGFGYEALELFEKMMDEGIKPNNVTFLSLLSACSHCGLLREGCEIFYLMKSRYGIQPDINHYTCVVDLLGRYGKIKEALAIILKFVCAPDSRIWGAILGACRVYEDLKHGEYAARCLLELEHDNVGYETLLSNVEACWERWDKVEEIRSAMDDTNLARRPGWSCIEVGL